MEKEILTLKGKLTEVTRSFKCCSKFSLKAESLVANKEDTILKGKNMLVVAQKEFSAMKQKLAQVKF